MLVEEIMKREVIHLQADATIAEALQLLERHHIRHIPIVDESLAVTGIVSDRDLRDASPSVFNLEDSEHELNHPLDSIMSQPVVTVHPLDFVEEIARIFYEQEFAALPVVQNNQLVGIVTEKDMLHTLIQLTGTNVQSSHIEVKVPHRPGILPEVASLFGKRNVNIVSVLIYPFKDDPNFKILVFRIQTMNPLPLLEDLREAGYELMWPNTLPEGNQ
ncbi:acetoin utilization AcuB family protein [Lentibacillus sediminis]|uniref:acetoin utilization AcuB family protein n=1 Tax=Lentibacillus sediminis TaxID=1940529 RepID=UPI000C1BF266|nr:acetoin utilization AcuB family protein [Lentibacillus sediminis]